LLCVGFNFGGYSPVPTSSCSGDNCCVGEKLSGYTNCGGTFYACMYMIDTNSVNCTGVDGTIS